MAHPLPDPRDRPAGRPQRGHGRPRPARATRGPCQHGRRGAPGDRRPGAPADPGADRAAHLPHRPGHGCPRALLVGRPEGAGVRAADPAPGRDPLPLPPARGRRRRGHRQDARRHRPPRLARGAAQGAGPPRGRRRHRTGGGRTHSGRHARHRRPAEPSPRLRRHRQQGGGRDRGLPADPVECRPRLGAGDVEQQLVPRRGGARDRVSRGDARALAEHADPRAGGDARARRRDARRGDRGPRRGPVDRRGLLDRRGQSGDGRRFRHARAEPAPSSWRTTWTTTTPDCCADGRCRQCCTTTCRPTCVAPAGWSCRATARSRVRRRRCRLRSR